ncbi:MAG: bifunctional 4-hydroxy-2-oxoglutarate aldolase/2-dehydro-3-deoxy-phosphogluconate aldolase, partial [Anaerolineae bacterium]|nr:bifunctional 4-hydroxy-2-oxoglutarate aldolase/2-dehydro-3-deoxy-phosphogluconate aldolase [Anaerolineae bacterium]
PTPWSKLMPTGGVRASYEDLKAWFDAGVACVGMGSALVRKDLVAACDWEGLAAHTRQCLAWVEQARS